MRLRGKGLLVLLPVWRRHAGTGGCVADGPPREVDATAGDRDAATVTWLPPLVRAGSRSSPMTSRPFCRLRSHNRRRGSTGGDDPDP